jgi:hypothetical protein
VGVDNNIIRAVKPLEISKSGIIHGIIGDLDGSLLRLHFLGNSVTTKIAGGFLFLDRSVIIHGIIGHLDVSMKRTTSSERHMIMMTMVDKEITRMSLIAMAKK